MALKNIFKRDKSNTDKDKQVNGNAKTFWHVLSVLFSMLLFSQIPIYFHDYRNGVQAEITSINRLLIEVDTLAAQRDMNLFDYIRRLNASSDPMVKKQGHDYTGLLSKKQKLVNASELFDNTNGWDALFLMPLYMEYESFKNGLLLYSVGFELSVIFVGYVFFGIAFGFFVPIIPGLFTSRQVIVPAEQRLDTETEEDQLALLLRQRQENRKAGNL